MKLEDIIDIKNIKYNEPMSKHTTMRVGGNADVLVIPTTNEEVINIIKYAKINKIPFKVLGVGSNVIVGDNGIEGIVIKITNKMEDIKIIDDVIIATAGSSMPKVAIKAKGACLTGFEFACGIPGTIGGGTRMNAGAYGKEFSDIVESVKYLDEDLNIKELKKQQLKFGYRKSIFDENKNLIVLETTFKLKKGNKEDIEKIMNDNKLARISKQPLNKPNAGSIFKRPEGYFAGKLIQDSELQGKSIGGAQVSTKHAGFIVNTGNATCKDIKDLIKLIQKTIKEKFDVSIETEVEFIGRD